MLGEGVVSPVYNIASNRLTLTDTLNEFTFAVSCPRAH